VHDCVSWEKLWYEGFGGFKAVAFLFVVKFIIEIWSSIPSLLAEFERAFLLVCGKLSTLAPPSKVVSYCV
jgi:hypothetical protein